MRRSFDGVLNAGEQHPCCNFATWHMPRPERDHAPTSKRLKTAVRRVESGLRARVSYIARKIAWCTP